MRFFTILSFAAASLASVVEKRECSGNNCNRQVTGTRPGLLPIESRQADCSSFMIATVTPATRTITVTAWVAPTDPPMMKRAPEVHARQETGYPSDIPTYASSCDDAAEYSSACSCWGITATTTTLRRGPRTTVTVTETAGDCTAMALTAVPSCAHDCFASVVPQFGCTGIDDVACQCDPEVNASIYDVVPECLATACPRESLGAVEAGASNACGCHSATATGPWGGPTPVCH